MRAAQQAATTHCCAGLCCATHCLPGGARFDDGAGGDNEVQRTMLEIVNQLDGFDARGNVKVRCSWWGRQAATKLSSCWCASCMHACMHGTRSNVPQQALRRATAAAAAQHRC
jgi:hypothetical protein